MIRALAIALIVPAVAVSAAFQSPAPVVLAGADGTVCDLVAANAGLESTPNANAIKAGLWDERKRPFSDMLVKRAIVDVDGDGKSDILEITSDSRSRESPTIGGVRTNYQEMPYYEESEGLRWLSYAGAWHAVYFDDHRLRLALRVVTLTPNGPVESCRLDAKFNELIKPRYSVGPEATACDAMTDPETKMARPEPQDLAASDIRYLTTGIRAQQWYEYKAPEDAGIHIMARHGPERPAAKPVTVMDIDGDGNPERLLKIERYGTTRCNATVLDLLPSIGEEEVDPVKRAMLMAMQGEGPARPGEYDIPTACGLKNAFVTIDGRPYLYVRRTEGGVERSLSKIENGHERMVCSGEYMPHHTVAFDASKTKSQGASQ